MRKLLRSKALRCGMAFVLAMILILSSVAPLFASDLDTLKEEKEDLENQAAENQGEQAATQIQIDAMNEEIAAVNAEIRELDEQINECVKNIHELEGKIADNEKQLEETEKQLEEAKEEEAKHYEELKARLRMMYEYGDVNYLELFLGAKDISDFFSRIEYVGQMAEYDKKIQDNLQSDREKIQEIEGRQEQTQLELNIDRAKLEKEKEALEEAMQQKQLRYEQLEATKAEYEQYLSYLAEQEAELQALIDEKVNEINSEEERLAALESNNNGGGSSGSSSSGGFTSTGSFIWPVPSSYYISSPYGWRIHPIWGTARLHAGTDIAADYGEAILAADGGTVIYAGYNESYGNFVMISHPSGYVTLYAHSSQLLVYSGQTVSQGETIALIGSTGDSTGPHCHFEVRINGGTVDAMNFFS